MGRSSERLESWSVEITVEERGVLILTINGQRTSLSVNAAEMLGRALRERAAEVSLSAGIGHSENDTN